MAERKFKVTRTLDWFRVRAASTANVTIATLDAGQTLDGVTLAQNDRVLLKNQTDATQNGIYVINADGNAATRATDYAAGYKAQGSVVKVTAGTANARTGWFQYTEPGTVGTDALQYLAHQVDV